MSPIKRQCVYINKLYPNLFISSRIYGGFIQIIPFIIMNHTNDDWILKRSEKKQSILLSFIYWVPFFDRMRKVREESQFGNGDVHFETSNLCHVLIWCSFFAVASNSKQMIILRRIGWKKISRIRSHSSLPWHCTSSAHKKTSASILPLKNEPFQQFGWWKLMRVSELFWKKKLKNRLDCRWEQ